MGDYTRINIVRSATGFDARAVPSGTMNLCIRQGESNLKLYLGVTPASDAVSMAGTNMWVETAATAFAAHRVNLRLANEHSAEQAYQGQLKQVRGAPFKGRAWSVEIWWLDATRTCDLYGRDIIIKRVES